MVDTEYANAYSEVLEIINYISEEDYNKIPKEIIDVFNKNKNNRYRFRYDMRKTLDEQKVSKKAKTIIAILFRDYWATEKQREKILAKERHDIQKIERKKHQKYNPEEIFKNKSNTLCKSVNLDLVTQEKESIYIKIISIIKKLLDKFFSRYQKK